jgi:AcrR family transcriptional regulator
MSEEPEMPPRIPKATPPDLPVGAALPPSGETAKPATSPLAKRQEVVEALMRLAADRPWNDIEITDVAQEAGVSLAEMRDMFPSKGAILDGFTRMIDRKVIEGTTDDLIGEPARERIFDVTMRRLDAMAPYKRALRRISIALRSDLGSLAALNRSGLNSQRYMLAAAGVPTEGPLGFVKLQGMVVALANVMETWFDDDDPTLARTMARLDRELRRGERVMERADDLRRLTAPLRALGQALIDGRSRTRRRSGRRPDDDHGEETDPAAAI